MLTYRFLHGLKAPTTLGPSKSIQNQALSQRPLKEKGFTKDYCFRFGDFNHPKLGTKILIVLDF